MITQTIHNSVVLQRMVADLLMEETSDVILTDLLNCILRTYSRMRGKDLVRRIMGKKTRSLSLHTQQKVAAKSDPSNYKKFKTEKGIHEDIESDLGNEISEQDHLELQHTIDDMTENVGDIDDYDIDNDDE